MMSAAAEQRSIWAEQRPLRLSTFSERQHKFDSPDFSDLLALATIGKSCTAPHGRWRGRWLSSLASARRVTLNPKNLVHKLYVDAMGNDSAFESFL